MGRQEPYAAVGALRVLSTRFMPFGAIASASPVKCSFNRLMCARSSAGPPYAFLTYSIASSASSVKLTARWRNAGSFFPSTASPRRLPNSFLAALNVAIFSRRYFPSASMKRIHQILESGRFSKIPRRRFPTLARSSLRLPFGFQHHRFQFP